MQATKSANIDVAQSRIHELTDAARYRRGLDAEIANVTESCARERSRLADISSLREQCGEKIAAIEAKLVLENQNRERLGRDLLEAGRSGVIGPVRPSKSAKRRRGMDERRRAEIRAEVRKTEVKNPRKILKHFGRALTTEVSKSRVAGRLNLIGIKRAENIFIIGPMPT